MLQAIRLNEPVTRIDLARITGLTPPAIANITRRLLADGLISEIGRRQGQRGQPAIELAISPDGCYSIGLNVDRDHISIVAVDLLGRVRASVTQETAFALPLDVAGFFEQNLQTFLDEGRIDIDRLIGIGVALPDDLGGLGLPNRPESHEVWRHVDVANLLRQIVQKPIFIENDATAAALGELQFGHGAQHTSFFYILISAAMGGGLVLDGAYFRGANGRSGEIGFLPIDAGSEPMALQDIVSLSALFALLDAEGYRVDTPADLLHLDERASGLINAWLDRSAELLAKPLVSIACLIDPRAVFIGGRLPEPLIDQLVQRLNRRLAESARIIPAIPLVQRAATAADAAAIGAAILPFLDLLLPTRSALLKRMPASR